MLTSNLSRSAARNAQRALKRLTTMPSGSLRPCRSISKLWERMTKCPVPLLARCFQGVTHFSKTTGADLSWP